MGVPLLTLLALKLAKWRFCCDVMHPPHVVRQHLFRCVSFVTLPTTELPLVFEVFVADVRTSWTERERRKCDVMRFLHVLSKHLLQCVLLVADVTFELARGRFRCDVMHPLLVVNETSFIRVRLVALVTRELPLEFPLPGWWMLGKVVRLQLADCFVEFVADLTNEITLKNNMKNLAVSLSHFSIWSLRFF